MANNFQGINCLNDSDFPINREELGSYGYIHVEKSRWNITLNTDFTKWCASYTIDGSKCMVINVYSTIDKHAKVSFAAFEFKFHILKSSKISNREFIIVRVEKDKVFLCSTPRSVAFGTCPISISEGLKNCRQKNNKTITSDYVIETRAYIYSINESKGGLLVVEEMRKSGDNQKPCKITVAHYFTASRGKMFSLNKMDIGLSVIVTIQPSSEVGLDVTLEGPTKHPTAALHYMFEEVMETGNWKPTICPHCFRIERLHIDMFRLVNSEYNDSFQPPNGRIPRKVIIVNNNGSVTGHGNGNILMKGNVYIINIYINFPETSQAIKEICKRMGISHVEIKM